CEHQDQDRQAERADQTPADPSEDLALVNPARTAVTRLPHGLAVALLRETLRRLAVALLRETLRRLAVALRRLAETTLLRRLAEAALLRRLLAETALLALLRVLLPARVVLRARRRGVRDRRGLRAGRDHLRGLAALVLPARWRRRLHHLRGVARACRLVRRLTGLHHLGGLWRVTERRVLLLRLRLRAARRTPLVLLLRIRWLGSTHVGSIPL